MSSKEQLKDALKRANVANAELKKENERLEDINHQLIMTVQHLRVVFYLRKEQKKWWKFWYKPYKK